MLTIDVTKSTGLTLLRVMQTTSPIDGDITLPTVQSGGTLHAASRADATEFEQAIKHGTIIPDIVATLLFRESVHVVGSDAL